MQLSYNLLGAFITRRTGGAKRNAMVVVVVHADCNPYAHSTHAVAVSPSEIRVGRTPVIERRGRVVLLACLLSNPYQNIAAPRNVIWNHRRPFVGGFICKLAGGPHLASPGEP